jgi:hypothetical protein
MRQEFRGYGVFLFLLGIVLLIVAGIQASQTTVHVETPGVRGIGSAPNTTAGLASCGFAIAGGFCFLAAALVYVGDIIARRPAERTSFPTPAKEQPGSVSRPTEG